MRTEILLCHNLLPISVFYFMKSICWTRYNAAAGAGFRGVETPFPYSVPPEAFAARLQSCGLTQVLCNLPPGNWDAGERGFGAVPGQEEAFAESLEQGLEVCAGSLLSPPPRHGWHSPSRSLTGEL